MTVLLIEQGPVADSWMSRVPLLSSNITSKEGVATRWWSLPLQKVDNRFVEILRGEALGGTSRLNGMLYTRGMHHAACCKLFTGILNVAHRCSGRLQSMERAGERWLGIRRLGTVLRQV